MMTNLINHANDLSGQWIEGIWAAVWQSTVLAVGILLLTFCLKRAPASLRFWLWMLVPLRLLVMPVISIDLPVLPPTVHETSTVSPIEAAEFSGASIATPLQAIPQGDPPAEPTDAALGSVAPAAESPDDSLPAGGSPSFWTFLMVVWIYGVLLMALRMCVGYWKTRRIATRAVPVQDERMLDLMRRAARMIGLRRLPRVVVTGEKVSPFVLGVRRPVIVLPATFVDRVNHSQLLAVLAHEAAHLRRNDFMVGWIVAVCEIIYFFHPLVHYVNRKLLLEREKACDDWVLAGSRAKPSTYAKAILSAASATCTVETHVKPRALVAESFTELSQRISAIAKTVNPKAGLSGRACIMLVVLGVLCIPGIGLTSKEAASVEPGAAGTQTATAVANARSEAPLSEETLFASNGAVDTPAVPERVAERRRILRFPENSDLGSLSYLVRPDTHRYRFARDAGGFYSYDQWQELGPARGAVPVPANKPLKLTVYAGGKSSLADLGGLAHDDLHTISFSVGTSTDRHPLTDEQVLSHIQHLTGLKVVELISVNTTGPGLRFIKDHRELERLSFGTATTFEEDNLAYLQNLTSLQALDLFSPVSDDGLRHLKALTSLRELKIKYGNAMRGPGLAHIAAMPSLEFLEIDGSVGQPAGGPPNSALRYLEDAHLRSLLLYDTTNLNDGAIRYLTRLPNLEELKFIKWGGTLPITDAGMRTLGAMTQLRVLDVGSTHVTDNGLAELHGLTALEELHLPRSVPTRTEEHTLSDATLAVVSQFPRLRILFAGTGNFTDDGLRHLSVLRRLETLVIRSDSDAATDAGLASIAGLPRLRWLNIHWAGTTNRGVAELARLTSLQKLDLDCDSDRITVSGVNALNRLANLRELTVSRVMRDQATLDLGALTNLSLLNISIRDPRLSRRETAIRDAEVASIGNLRNLTYLALGTSPYLTDAGMAPIANLTRLERLFFGGHNLTDEALAHVSGLTSLYQLVITGDFTDQGVRQIDPLTGIRYLTINTRRSLNPQTEQQFRSNLPNLFSIQLARAR